MPAIGDVTKRDNAYHGELRTLAFRAPIDILPNSAKNGSKQSDYRVFSTATEIGAGWVPQAVAPAEARYRPTDAQIAYFLARFITDVRGLSIDPVVVRNNWLEAYDLATDHGSVFLDGFAQATNPFTHVGERSIAVQVTSVVRVSEASFQVKWLEQTYEHDALAKTEHWTAILPS